MNPTKTFHICMMVVLCAIVAITCIQYDVRYPGFVYAVAVTPFLYYIFFTLLKVILTKEVRMERWGGITHTKRIWRWKKHN